MQPASWRAALPTLPAQIMIQQFSRWGSFAGPFVLVVTAVLVGCSESETISTYETERTEPRPKAVNVEQVRKSLDHMLVAIVPHGDAAWFFKLVANADAIEELRKPFEELVASVELGEPGETPEWTLPEGWTQTEGGEMRTATILVPRGAEKLELAVSTLPLAGDWDDYLTRNVNRWMGQLQQGELDEKTVKGLAKSLPHKGGEAAVIELVGVMQQTPGMMPPGHPPAGSNVPAATAGSSRESDSTPRPADSTPRPTAPFAPMGGAVQPAEEFAKPREFTYDPPAGWQPGQINMMRKAAFVVADGGKQASVTVTQFPAVEEMSNPIAQGRRWAGEAGLQLSEAELNERAKPVNIDGIEGQEFELIAPVERESTNSVRAAMVRRGEQMWFFKMWGERSLVEKQGEAFGKFLQSVKFTGE
jgi:hypothetical protein